VDAEPASAWVVSGDEPKYRVTRHEEAVIRRSEAPTLTITSDPYISIYVCGGRSPDWSISLCAYGEGATENEARERLQHVSMHVTRSTVSLVTAGRYAAVHYGAQLIVAAPADAGLVVHASNAYVEVRDMKGPVRVAAARARATVLNATGLVDVTASCVDYSGSSGAVSLDADGEINLRMLASTFDGTLMAWAQRSVRMLAPAGFRTPVDAVVGNAESFIGRADFAASMAQRLQCDRHIFANTPPAASASARAPIHLQSESSTVVIDTDPHS
jgi:hypothetical protein